MQLQRLPDRSPILRGRFHDDFVDLTFNEPVSERAQFSGACPHLHAREAVVVIDVDVAGVNTTETIIAGELHSAVAVSLSPHTEQVVVDVTTKVVEGVAA